MSFRSLGASPTRKRYAPGNIPPFNLLTTSKPASGEWALLAGSSHATSDARMTESEYTAVVGGPDGAADTGKPPYLSGSTLSLWMGGTIDTKNGQIIQPSGAGHGGAGGGETYAFDLTTNNGWELIVYPAPLVVPSSGNENRGVELTAGSRPKGPLGMHTGNCMFFWDDHVWIPHGYTTLFDNGGTSGFWWGATTGVVDGVPQGWEWKLDLANGNPADPTALSWVEFTNRLDNGYGQSALVSGDIITAGTNAGVWIGGSFAAQWRTFDTSTETWGVSSASGGGYGQSAYSPDHHVLISIGAPGLCSINTNDNLATSATLTSRWAYADFETKTDRVLDNPPTNYDYQNKEYGLTYHKGLGVFIGGDGTGKIWYIDPDNGYEIKTFAMAGTLPTETESSPRLLRKFMYVEASDTIVLWDDNGVYNGNIPALSDPGWTAHV